MKRFSAAAVAVATALSLSAMPATAAERNSSDVSDAEMYEYVGSSALVKDNLTSSARIAAKEVQKEDVSSLLEMKDSSAAKSMHSSLKNDTAKGYPVGTTAEIVAGASIGALVLAIAAGVANAARAGLIFIPGLTPR